MSEAVSNTGNTRDCVLRNPKGLHARPAAVFVQSAQAFQADIEVCNTVSGVVADGKSVLSMLMLAAPCGTKIRLTVNGTDKTEALKVLGDLLECGLDDDDE